MVSDTRFDTVPASLVAGCRFYVVQRNEQGRLVRLVIKLDGPTKDTWCGVYHTLGEARHAARKHMMNGDTVSGVLQVDTHGQTFHGSIAYRQPSEELAATPEGWGEW